MLSPFIVIYGFSVRSFIMQNEHKAGKQLFSRIPEDSLTSTFATKEKAPEGLDS